MILVIVILVISEPKLNSSLVSVLIFDTASHQYSWLKCIISWAYILIPDYYAWMISYFSWISHFADIFFICFFIFLVQLYNGSFGCS